MSSYHVAATSSDSATIKKEEVVEEDGAAVNENCDLNHRLVKKEEEEEKDGDIECNSSKNEDEDDDEDDDDDDDYYADWKVGNWCWVLPSAATNTCNNDVTTTNHQNHTNNHSVKSEEIDTNTNTNTNTNGPSTCSSRKRTATTRSSHNTSSNNNEETPKRKKARSLSRPVPPSNNKNNTAIKREEEDNLCDNNEVNNKMNDDDDDDGYESWTEGNWCLLLPTISNTSTTVKTSNEQQQHSSEISPTNIKRRKQPVHGKYRSQTSPRVNGTGEKKNAFDEDYSDNDDENEEPKKSRTGENTMRAYMKRMDKRWNEMFHRLISYKNQHNSTSVPHNYAADIELGNWVSWQRHVYNHNKKILSVDRIKRLESIGFVWDVLEKQWMAMYDRLMMYKKKHKSTQVPYSYTEDNQLFPLGVWVYKQKYSYRDGKLLKKRMELLNSIDFDWKAK
jgi:hypothetical protein